MKHLGVASLIAAAGMIWCQQTTKSIEKTAQETAHILVEPHDSILSIDEWGMKSDSFAVAKWLEDKRTQKLQHEKEQEKQKYLYTTASSPAIDSVESEPQDTTITYTIKELLKNKDALVTNSKNFSLLYVLGEQDVNTIIKQYNPHLAKQKPDNFDWRWTKFTGLDSLIIPKVFPSVKEFFLEDLWDFLQDKQWLQETMQRFFSHYPKAAEVFKENETCIIQTKLPNETMGIAYYENGKLLLAAPASIGNGKRYPNPIHIPWEDSKFHARSPQWAFFIIDKVAHKRNRQWDNMPYYMEFNARTKQWNLRWLGIHGWQLVTGDPKSHWCSRFVHALAKPLFEKAQKTTSVENPWTPVFAYREPYQEELDSVHYYTKTHPKKIETFLARTEQEIDNPYREKIAQRRKEKNNLSTK